jgi:thiol:disulfide interchange protein DsbD
MFNLPSVSFGIARREALSGLMSLLVVLSSLFFGTAYAADDFLEPEKAFRFSAKMLDAKTAEVSYSIADGYYMYRERFAVKAEGATIGQPEFPPGKVKFDETFQKNVETYRQSVTFKVPVEAAGSFTLRVTGQGCSDKGLCYAPMESQVKLSSRGGLAGAITAAAGPSMNRSGSGGASTTDGVEQTADSDMGRIEATLKGGRLLAILPLFLLLGLGLSFTPCVLPMVPILSSIIVGEGVQVSRGKGFILSASYSLGMALVYTSLGVAAGLVGEGLSAALQKPWVLGAFALLMAGLSLSMFGVYQLQVPAAVQQKLMKASDGQAAGKLIGVFAMGAISALIVGPCVAAPLAGALLYISQTRDVLIGGGALFAMAVGMSVPLILIGVSAGALLPRAGAWMEAVKFFFGVLMLGLALWIVVPVVPGWVPMAGWAALGLGYGAYLIWYKQWGKVSKFIGVAFALLGLVQLVGVLTGGRDPIAPLAHLSNSNVMSKAEFTRVKSVADLDAAIARANGKPVMLDFYADWCVSCKEMEKLTFSDPRIKSTFADMVLLQADVTANDEDDKAMLRRFKLFGPPGIIFFDKQGREVQGQRVIGYQDADKFLQSLSLARTS